MVVAGAMALPARSADTAAIEINGVVEAGQSFTAALPRGLVLELRAAEDAPPGWTITIYPAGAPEADTVWPANEPYRGDNVRYVDTSYGKTPAEMLAWNPREFLFYTDPAAAAAAVEWVKAQLWPGDNAPPDPPAPDGHGELTILDSRIGSVGGEPAVTWMAFRFRLRLAPE